MQTSTKTQRTAEADTVGKLFVFEVHYHQKRPTNVSLVVPREEKSGYYQSESPLGTSAICTKFHQINPMFATIFQQKNNNVKLMVKEKS